MRIHSFKRLAFRCRALETFHRHIVDTNHLGGEQSFKFIFGTDAVDGGQSQLQPVQMVRSARRHNSHNLLQEAAS